MAGDCDKNIGGILGMIQTGQTLFLSKVMLESPLSSSLSDMAALSVLFSP